MSRGGFFGASLRFSFVIVATLAFPSFAAPFFPSDTVAGSFLASESSVFGACPVASTSVRNAVVLTSSRIFGFFFGDFAIP